MAAIRVVLPQHLRTLARVEGEVTLDVDATGAEIYVDGDLEGQTPLPGSI